MKRKYAMDIKNRVALRIKITRKNRQLSQAELAERIDRTADAVSQLERGVSLPSFETLERLAKALDVPIRDFFDFEEGLNAVRTRLMASLMDYIRALNEQDLEAVVQMARFLAERKKI